MRTLIVLSELVYSRMMSVSCDMTDARETDYCNEPNFDQVKDLTDVDNIIYVGEITDERRAQFRTLITE